MDWGFERFFRGRIFRGRSKEEGGRRNVQIRGRFFRGMWNVEGGMRNVHSIEDKEIRDRRRNKR